MLRKLAVRGFKSIADVSVEFPRLAVLFGPNSAGKSNLLDSIQALSRIGTERTFMEALDGRMIRGYAFELFALPKGGHGDLASQPPGQFAIGADLTIPGGSNGGEGQYRYRTEVEIDYGSGALGNRGEFLTALTKAGEPKGNPAIEVEKDKLSVRRQSGGGRPRLEPLGQNYTILSDARLASPGYRYIDRARKELRDWRTYYLDPRVAMRADRPPMDVVDIGVFGQDIAPFLYKLKGEHPKRFEAVARTVRAVVPGIERVDVVPDPRGFLHLFAMQNATPFSSRVLSEGTLRVIALCAIAVNPWSSSLLAFEEPENGVHPRRIELIATMLVALALDQGRQVVVTTHSPLFCDAVLREARARSTDDIGLFNVRQVDGKTVVDRFAPLGRLLDDPDIREALVLPGEYNPFESLMLSGFIDE